ncbi:MAG TPA: DUF2281 domain-containing protein [Spirochaetota bacterium]|nr:DUF2281 domain-containing protein [Spirochaetota bacterium]HOS32266.1 DUF2281 domain-containing protein [Spirochaetota bacterium]HOS55677.1 DUF2281 domain-containing protein [Spirochaetota bacterium]HPK61367.1 DUF2281 domain-containing protein [Spirochaetota bacterium]HQF78074.1 DUF2281 domain-containing protein [Spirochaetota bacterium]
MVTAKIKEKIKMNINKMPEEYLKDIDNYIEYILFKSSKKNAMSEKFEGIWKDIGFEKIIDVDNEIRNIRNKSQADLINIE